MSNFPSIDTANHSASITTGDKILGRFAGSATSTLDGTADLAVLKAWLLNQAVFTGGMVLPRRTVTAAGAVTVALTDYTVAINKTTGAATAVALPAGVVDGQVFIIKDEKGDAGTNNITITPNAGTIEGSATYVISTNRAVIWMQWDASTSNYMLI